MSLGSDKFDYLSVGPTPTVSLPSRGWAFYEVGSPSQISGSKTTEPRYAKCKWYPPSLFFFFFFLDDEVSTRDSPRRLLAAERRTGSTTPSARTPFVPLEPGAKRGHLREQSLNFPSSILESCGGPQEPGARSPRALCMSRNIRLSLSSSAGGTAGTGTRKHSPVESRRREHELRARKQTSWLPFRPFQPFPMRKKQGKKRAGGCSGDSRPVPPRRGWPHSHHEHCF